MRQFMTATVTDLPLNENGKKITTKLLDNPGYDDFESQDTDTYRVELPHRVSPDKFHVVVRFHEVLVHTDSWTTDRIEINLRYNYQTAIPTSSPMPVWQILFYEKIMISYFSCKAHSSLLAKAPSPG